MSKIIYDHEIENLCFKMGILGKDRVAIQEKGITDKAVVKSILETMLKQKPKPAESRMAQFNRLYKVRGRQARQRANANAFLRGSEEAERKRDAAKAGGYDPNTETLAKQVEQMYVDGKIPIDALESTMRFLGIPLVQSEPQATVEDMPF